jgi:dolichol-phosphate mannosyltransferase
MNSPSPTTLTERLWCLIDWLHGFRYVRFGLVGASGTVINLAVLYTAHEYLFSAFEPPGGKPYFSLALAIVLATINNFTWNRLWTWSDRQHATSSQREAAISKRHLLAQLVQYATASWIGIALQYALTLWLAHYMHYMLANLIAILIASVSNFITNDRRTFRHRNKG